MIAEANAILAISYRDLLKFLRDPARLVSTLIFPLIFIGILGGALQSNFGSNNSYNWLVYVFTGVLAQTLFQSTAQGVISLIEDRENDFSQEIFVSPISRYSIVFGKILGETLVSLPQGIAVVIFALVLGIPITVSQMVGLLIVAVVVCLFSGAFGIMMLASFNSQRTANQIFPFILFPQFFTAGVFTPIRVLPFYLDFLSRISPLRYAVDFARGIFYQGTPDYSQVVLASPLFNLGVMAAMFLAFLAAGTFLFVRGERNR